jgi:Viral BACON domain/Secretion system C-terminal sorting domain
MKTITKFFAIVAISLASLSAFAQPTTTLTPTVPAGKAMFTYNSSGAYTNAALMTLSPNEAWGGLFVSSSFTINGKNVICLTPSTAAGGAGVYYHGASLASTIDVSSMKYLHVDIWVPASLEFTNLGVSPISTGGNQYLYNLESATGFTKGSWNSIDIPLTYFTGWAPSPVNLASLFQFIVKADQAAGITSIPNNTVYLDNVYYWTDVTVTLAVSVTSVDIAQPANNAGNFAVTATQNWTAASDQSWLTVSPTSGTSAGATVTLTATANTSSASRNATVTVTGTDATKKTVTVTQAGLPISASPTPTVAAANVKSIYSDAYTAAVTNFDYIGQQWWNSTWSAVTLAGAGNALKLVSTTAGGGGGGIQFGALTITGMTNLHFDIYPGTDAVGATIKYTVTPAGAWIVLPTPSNHGTLTANVWNSFDIPVSSLASGASTLPTQVGFGTFSGPGTFYVDNVLFYNGTYTSSTGISSVIADNGIKCYPSMANNSLNVRADNEISEISIISLVGQSLKTVTVNSNSKVINLNDLVSGQYLVRIKLANGQIGTQKFVKL